MTYTVDRLNCIIAHYYIYQQTDRVRERVITCLGDQSMYVVSSSVISAGSRCSTKLYNGYYYSCDYYYSSSLQIKRTDIPKQRTTKLRFKQQQNRVRIEYHNIRSNGYSMRNTKIKTIQLVYTYCILVWGGDERVANYLPRD